MTEDDHRAAVAMKVPEFAGIFVDPKTKEWIVLVTDGSQESATRAKIEFERRTGISRDVSLRDYSPVPRPQKAKYSFLELYRWYRPAVDEVHAAMEVRTSGIDEVGNVLRFGVADPNENRECVEAGLARLGIPEDAYVFEEQGEITFG